MHLAARSGAPGTRSEPPAFRLSGGTSRQGAAAQRAAAAVST